MRSNNFFRGKKYLKDKKISIVEFEEGQDSGGFSMPSSNIPIKNGENIWAYYRHASGDEIYAAKAENYKEEAVFKVNWRNDIKLRMKMLFKGQECGITRIDDCEEYKEHLTLYPYTLEAE